MNTIEVVTGTDPQPPRTDRNARPRQPGWAVLIGVLGVALFLIGAVLIAMLQAPVVRHRVIVTAWVLMASGIILLPVAWLGRRR
ncbi:MAG TPA: hypothetical protein VN541_22065 [Tepidisphaeraceae bacterium]|nr:hypothetical protein [Tepidisphaeraceae bacterium]